MSNSIDLMCYSDVSHKEFGSKIINKLKGFTPWTNMH